MTAVHTVVSAKATAVTAAAATSAADQDQRVACCTQSRMGAVEIARLCECGIGGNSKRKSAKKT